MDGTVWVLIAAAAFVGTHFALSHPLRAPIVRVAGERGFLGVYSVVAIATLVWLVNAYKAAPATSFLWPVGGVLWAVVTAIMLVASVLLMGSLVRNPALPTGGAPAPVPQNVQGVYAVTRHPMLWSFALWGICHAAVYPMASNIILAGAIVVLSLIGATMQDRKKEKLQPQTWPGWKERTSYWPFAAIIDGRARLGGFGGHALGGGLVLWLAATWAHIPLAGWTAGIWRWIY